MAMNRKAWIKIIEAFFAAMLVIVVLVIVANQQQNNSSSDPSSQIYGYETSIIRAVQLNSTLRQEVIGVSTLPLNSENSTFPSELNDTINSKTPSSLICKAQICKPESTCDYWKSESASIYAQDVIITATSTTYSPRKMKIFCFQK